MKVLLINGSPHLDGCTFTALNEVATTLNKEDIETEIIHIGNKNIRGCISCFKCRSTGVCVFDDEVNVIAKKFEECDGLIVGSPTYFAGPNGTLVSFLDRLFFSTQFNKSMKVGACISSARRAGNTSVFDQLNKYFTISNMPIVSSQYWNMTFGYNKEDALSDLEGMQTMRTLGLNMAFLIKSIYLGKEKYGIPEREKKVNTNFIK